MCHSGGQDMAHTTEFKKTALNRAKAIKSIPQAAKEFGVDSRTMYRWNEEYHICDIRPMREFSDEEKKGILEYANTHGLTGAMREYDVNIFTILSWNKVLNIYQAKGRRENATHVQKYEKVSKEKKLEILNFVKEHNISAAVKKYNKASSTIQTWNAELKVYKVRRHRVFSDKQKADIIQYANITSVADAAKKFNLCHHQIRDWMKTKQK
jgi:transposase-like protein